MPIFEVKSLTDIAQRLLVGIGASNDDAEVVAEHLVTANLAGHDSHGMIRVPQYSADAESGKLVVAATPQIVRQSPTTALVDGGFGWGPVTAALAVELGLEKARTHGLSAIGIRRCHHVGRVGAFAERGAKAGFLTKIWCNGQGVARVAPWGGTEPRLATNPLAIGIPFGDAPIIIDLTTSVVAEGKIRLARNQGKRIPAGWVFDRDGKPTTDPADLYNGGSLAPLGADVGHKGFALGLAIDVLGGLLPGGGCGILDGPTAGNGLFLEFAAPACWLEPHEFQRRLCDYVTYLKSSPTRPGVEEILLPGEPERRVAERRMREGIEIDEETWRQLEKVAERINVELDTPFR